MTLLPLPAPANNAIWAAVAALLGAAAGYLLGQKQNKASDVSLPAGTTMGVRLDLPASYRDTTGYSNKRARFLKI